MGYLELGPELLHDRVNGIPYFRVDFEEGKVEGGLAAAASEDEG